MRNQILGNRYRILERIGEGGMAFVYVAMDEKLGRKVAIKVLHEHMEKNPDIRKRFQHEAQAVSSLEHPNIVKIYDFSGDHSERLWIVTEVIRGKNLAQYVQQFTGGWLHPIISAAVVREILKALDKAHTHGIVHRDVKPENIMLTVEGRVKLMDFGIAKDLGKSSMTMTGTFMGSPSYMSPEQIRGRDVDLRSDLYSLSVLFYEIITGRLPFTGQSTHDVVMKIMEGEFTYPKYIMPALPEAQNGMIVRGMSRDPYHRFQTARDYGAELDRFLSDMGFDESHIELERYFRDRPAFEERLANSKVALIQNSTMALRLRRTGAGTRPATAHEKDKPAEKPVREKTTRDRRDKTVPPSSSHQIPAAPPARSPFKVDDTWQKHIPTGRTGVQQAPAAAVGRNSVPPAAEPRAPTVAMRAATQAVYHPDQQRALAGMALPAPEAVPVGRPVVRQVPIRRRRSGARPQRSRDSWLGYVFGVIFVALLGGISMWGFWEVTSRIGAQSGTGTALNGGRATTTVPKKRKQRDGTPVTVKTTTRKVPIAPAVETPTRPDRPTTPNAKDRETGTGDTSRASKTAKREKKRPLKTQKEVRVLPASETGNPNVSVENTEIRVGRKTAAAAEPVAAPGVVAATPEAAEAPSPASEASPAPTSTPAENAKGKLSFASTPAAEIYIDGKRVGTTVDNTSNSGWLTTTAGSHSVELRRQGYVSHKLRVDLAGDEQKALPRVELVPTGAGAQAESEGQRGTLTVRANLFPVQVTVRNLADGSTQAFTLKSGSRAIPLANGRYRVRIDRNGDFKERDLVFSSGSQLTFSADFKDE